MNQVSWCILLKSVPVYVPLLLGYTCYIISVFDTTLLNNLQTWNFNKHKQTVGWKRNAVTP
jgi:hypothetical protein